MTIEAVRVVSVPVADPDRAKAFYRDVLGFDVVTDVPMSPTRRWIQVAPKGSRTSLTLVTWFDAMPAGSLQGLVLETADVESTRAEIARRGATPGPVESAPWGRYCTLRDPDGNGLVLQQSAAPA